MASSPTPMDTTLEPEIMANITQLEKEVRHLEGMLDFYVPMYWR